MYILAEPFSRDLVFFGVLIVICLCFGLYSLTSIIRHKQWKYYLILALSIIVIFIGAILAVKITMR